MIRNELREMISLAERLTAVGEAAVLATLFSASGSSYRPLGSMMLGGPSAALTVGGVSGGCLEEYIARRGRTLTEHQPAGMLSFESRPDAYQADVPSLGCGGSLEVLVERLTPDHLVFLRQLATAHEADQASVSIVEIEIAESSGVTVQRSLSSDDRLAAKLDPKLKSLYEWAMCERRSVEGSIGENRRAMVYYVRPLVRLVILGAGNDAQPLCALGHSLGWHVCVADRRARMATRNRFPDADQVFAENWWSALESITFTPQTAIIIMTHSLADDAEIVPLVADRSTMYVGVLGPEHRRRWLLENAESGDLPESFRNRLRGPVGLDLGERSASGIAVSIVSEILAELNDRNPKPLFRPATSEQVALGDVAELVRIPSNSHCR